MGSPGRYSSSWRMRLASYKFTMLLVSLLLLVLAPLIVGSSGRRSLILGSASLVVLLFGVLAVVRHRTIRIFAAALAVLASIMQVTSFVYGTQHYPELRLALFAAFLSLLAVVIVRDVLRAEAITWDKIQGAVCAYLLFGVAWGLLYAWVGIHDPKAFSGAGQSAAEYSRDPMIYFSFVTLTTLGYGDITPVSHTARTLSWLEAAFGQIYLVVLVARLVSLQLSNSTRGGKS